MTEKDKGWLVAGAVFIFLGAGFLTGVGALIIGSLVLEAIHKGDDE